MKPEQINQAVAERRNHYYDGIQQAESLTLTEDERMAKRREEIRQFIKTLKYD